MPSPCTRRSTARAFVRTVAIASAVAVVAVVASSQGQRQPQRQSQRQPQPQPKPKRQRQPQGQEQRLLWKSRAQGNVRGGAENVGDASAVAAVVAVVASSQGQRQPPQGQRRQPQPQPQPQGRQQKRILRRSRARGDTRPRDKSIGDTSPVAVVAVAASPQGQRQSQPQGQGQQEKRLLRKTRAQAGGARAQEENNIGDTDILRAGEVETTTNPNPASPRREFPSPLLLENASFSAPSPSSSFPAQATPPSSLTSDSGSSSDSSTVKGVSYGGDGSENEEEEEEEVTDVNGAGDGGSGGNGGGISSESRDKLLTGAAVIAGVAAATVVLACLFAWCKRTANASDNNDDDDKGRGGKAGGKKDFERWGRGMGPNPLVRGRPGALCKM